jgi:hypothetical protein
MKKIILLAAFLIFSGLSSLYAQHYTIQPIPSFNYQLTEPKAAFQEVITHGIPPNREKREMDVVISSSSTHPQLVHAKVWIVKRNGSTIKGPYTIYLNQVLSVPIDHSQWGVVIHCNWSVAASVWID